MKCKDTSPVQAVLTLPSQGYGLSSIGAESPLKPNGEKAPRGLLTCESLPSRDLNPALFSPLETVLEKTDLKGVAA